MSLRSADLDFVKELVLHLPSSAIQEWSSRYNTDLRSRTAGAQGVVIAPACIEEVAYVARLCNENRVPIIPLGGMTGLVGGHLAIGIPQPVMLSLARMNRVRCVNPGSSTMIAEAGCTLQSVQDAASEADRMFPLTVASKGSCHIGGNLATNAGGSHALRFGSMRDLCLGMEVVFANGDVWNGLSGLRKDNRGFDLRNLLIGSEGALGIITAACLRLSRKPVERLVALVGVSSPEEALKLFDFCMNRFGLFISAFELMSKTGLEMLAETHADYVSPFQALPEWLILIDVWSEHEIGIQDHAINHLAEAQERGLLSCSIVVDSDFQIQKIWNIREAIPEANRRIGSVSSHDIAVPLESIPRFIERAGKAVAAIGDFRVNCFGHMGDGNLHFNVFPPPGASVVDLVDSKPKIREAVYNVVRRLRGTPTAEHGTGRVNSAELSCNEDKAYIDSLHAIKSALDPRGILNPGVVIAQAGGTAA